jgi:hypothetical protein
VFFQGIVKSQTSDVLMNSPVKMAGDMKTPLLSHEGYDLLNLMACRSGMELVPGFDDLKRKNNGLLMLLGNGHFPLPWIELENWVRRGGTLLVAFDEAHLVYQWGVKQGARAAFRGSFSKVGSSRAVFSGRTPPMSLLSVS